MPEPDPRVYPRNLSPPHLINEFFFLCSIPAPSGPAQPMPLQGLIHGPIKINNKKKKKPKLPKALNLHKPRLEIQKKNPKIMFINLDQNHKRKLTNLRKDMNPKKKWRTRSTKALSPISDSYSASLYPRPPRSLMIGGGFSHQCHSLNLAHLSLI